MALAATTVWECQTGGSDTNGGGFDPGQTAGMATDGTATSPATVSPVFSSASYNFVAGDVGAWVYISSGTSSGGVVNAGWYQIKSVASNAATLEATIGLAVLKNTFIPSTLTGCVTGTTLTSATWAIDYSQQATAKIAVADAVTAGTTTITSASAPFNKGMVGSILYITGGTGSITAAWYEIVTFTNTTTVVVDRSTGLSTGTGATLNLGGALLSPAVACGTKVNNNQVWIKSGTYSITTTSTNVANGCISDVSTSNVLGTHLYEGYGSIRGDLGTAPILQASGFGAVTCTLMALAGSSISCFVRNITFDGANLGTAITGFTSSRRFLYYKLTAKNCNANGITLSGASGVAIRLVGTGCGGTSGTHYALNITAANNLFLCETYSNTVGGINAAASTTTLTDCLSYANTGASSDGFNVGGDTIINNATSYGNGRDGFRLAATEQVALVNCIAEGNTGKGISKAASSLSTAMLLNCATFNNTAGEIDTTSFPFQIGTVLGSGSFFTNAAAGNFSLNSTGGAGASVRATGIPGVFPAGTTTGFIDIGAVQHADPIGGSSTYVIGS